jgi:hypothetical protein
MLSYAMASGVALLLKVVGGDSGGREGG